MKTVLLYGDGGRNGLHRTWKAGVPNTATVVIYNDGAGEGLELHAEYSNTAAIGEQVKIKFTVINTAATSGTDLVGINVTSVQRDFRDSGKDRQAEGRAGCTIDGPISPGESGMCTATFTVNRDDVDNAPMELDATAAATTTDGIAASAPVRIYITIQDGIVVAFKDDSNLLVTESATTTADLVVKREGSLSEEFQVAYVTGVRGSTATAGEDYADRADPPGIITFSRNQSEATISFHIIDDEIDEARERFQVTLIPSEGVLVPAASSTRVVVIIDAHQSNDPYRPTASLQLASSGAVPEDQGSIVFAVVLDREWGRNAQYKVELLPDQLTATPVSTGSDIPGDFEDPGTVRVYIPAGETRAEFSVTLYDDDVREEDETFKLQLGSSDVATARTIGATSTALATIADDDRIPPAEVVLSLTYMDRVLESVPESSDRIEVTVTAYFPQIRWPGDAADAPLRPADPRDVDTVVRVQVDPNSGAANLVDFKPLKVKDAQGIFKKVESFDILIPVGGTSATATLLFRPVDDRIDEENETFILQGNIVDARGSTETNLPVTSASFSIADDDTRGITVTPESVLFSLALTEGGPPESYSMVLDSQPTGTVTITLAGEQDGLLRLMPDTLTYTASDWDTPKMVSVLALDDGEAIAGGLKSDRIIEQVSGGDYADQDVSDIPVYISDTTKTYVYLEDAQASESDGHIKFKVTVRPILHTANLQARYATVDGTAIAGQDYTAATSSFTVGSGRGSATIRIPIIDDQVYELAEKTFTLQLWLEGDKATLSGDVEVLTATGTIMDDETKPVVTIAGPEGALSYVSENAMGPLTFTLTLNGVSAEDVTVDYATDEARLLGLLSARQGLTDATPGEDYVPATGTFTFAPGETTKTVNVEVTNDDVSEDTEFFGLRISNPQNARIRARQAKDSADVGLLDNDLRGATIQPKSLMLAEPARGASTTVSGAYNVVLTSQPTDEVTISVGGQYEGIVTLSTTTLTFATSTWNIPQRVEVTLVRDFNAVSESVVLTHTPSGGDYTGVPLDSVTVSVRDSDTRGITVSRDELTLTEGGSNSYTVVLDSQPTATTTVTVIGVGSVSPTSSELTFATSNWNEPQTVTLTAEHDGDTSDEPKVYVRHEASGGDYNGLHGPDVGVTVRDDDTEVIVSFGQSAYTVSEGSTVTVTITLSADPERTVTIPMTKVNQGTASDADYSGVPASVTFVAGDTEESFTFSAASDDENDDGESVKLTFGSSLPTGVTKGSTNEAIVSITDDDVPSVEVSFERATYMVDEGSTVTVKVKLDADPERSVTIPMTKVNQGTTSPDADYSGVPASVTFVAGDTEESFTFSAASDDENDDGESVKLTFGSSLPTGVTKGSTNEAIVSITDDDVPSVEVSFERATYMVDEGSTVTVKVKLDADPERSVTIPITKVNQGTTSDADYSGVPASVTFVAGRHGGELHLLRRLRRRERRRRKREADLRVEPPHRCNQGFHQRGYRKHHRRRRAVGGGELRAGDVHGGRGKHRHRQGEAGRRPGAVRHHPHDQGQPGHYLPRRLFRRARQRHLQQRRYGGELHLLRRLRRRERRRRKREADLRVEPPHRCNQGFHQRGYRKHHRRRRAVGGGELRAGDVHGGRGKHRHRQGEAGRRPGAVRHHPDHQGQPGHYLPRRLFRRARQRHLCGGGHGGELHLLRRLRRRERRRRKREADLRVEPPHRCNQGFHQRGYRKHHRRRRAVGGGELRAGDVHGGRGKHRHRQGEAGRRPGAVRHHPDHQGQPGHYLPRRLFRRARQRHLCGGGHGGELHLLRRLRRRERRRRKREADLRVEPPHRCNQGFHQRGYRKHHRRRRAVGGGELRAGDVHGGRGKHRHRQGEAGRRPGAVRHHPDHQGQPGHYLPRRLFRRARQRHLCGGGHGGELHLLRRLRRRERRWGEREAGVRLEPPGPV